MRRDKKEVRSGQEAGFSAEPTRIDMQSSSRNLDETARQTSAGRRIVGVLASGLGRRSSSHYSPTGSPNSPSLLAKRQFAFPILAVLAVAALGLWLLLPGGALRAQESGAIEYAENGTDPVATLHSHRPRGAEGLLVAVRSSLHVSNQNIGWRNGDDANVRSTFDRSSTATSASATDGVLTFNIPPDHEMADDEWMPHEQHLQHRGRGLRPTRSAWWTRTKMAYHGIQEGGCRGHGRGRAGDDHPILVAAPGWDPTDGVDDFPKHEIDWKWEKLTWRPDIDRQASLRHEVYYLI